MIKVGLIGASMRVRGFVRALVGRYADSHLVTAVMDVDPGKMRAFRESLNMPLNCYTGFDELCDREKPDLLLISTVDCYHCEYVIKALERGIASITEKPLCINAGQCRDILAARQRNPNIPAVTSHNARYHISSRKIKELLDNYAIGQVNSVTYHAMIGFNHGASYFRRWNRLKEFSGGLQVHKASHHFDKLNWWLGSSAAEVTALGGLKCFGSAASPFHGQTCRTCDYTEKCRFATGKFSSSVIDYDLFYKYASPGSYVPDQCVFSPEIDIEDFFSVGIRYKNGVLVNFSLAAHCNTEGENIIFEGSTGRLEMQRQKHADGGCSSIRIIRHDQAEPEVYELKSGQGGHEGSDELLYEDLFGTKHSGHPASLEDGIQAVLIGAAVNESLASGKKIDVQSLL